MRFIVRVLPGLKDKAAARPPPGRPDIGGRPVSPFLPYEQDLFVAELSATHVCLLNKYNVVPHHLLAVTRAYREQALPIDRADFEALWTLLMAFDGLGFYNSGRAAGASQRHKHLQLVPLPLAPEGPAVPLEPLVETTRGDGRAGTLPCFRFFHALARLAVPAETTPVDAASYLLGTYHDLLARTDLDPDAPAPYNLLLTRRWMLLVPRARECFGAISVNALGFAGALLVRNNDELAVLQASGPLAVLEAVTLPSP